MRVRAPLHVSTVRFITEKAEQPGSPVNITWCGIRTAADYMQRSLQTKFNEIWLRRSNVLARQLIHR